MIPPGPALILYSRPGCHLCEEVLEWLEPRCRAASVRLEVRDVDDDPACRERFGLRIPVLAAGDTEIAAWPFGPEAVSAWLLRNA